MEQHSDWLLAYEREEARMQPKPKEVEPMAWVQKPNSGSIWKNDDRKAPEHPQMKGSALVDGTEYWVNAWTKETKDGVRYQTLSFKPKEPAPVKQAPPPQRQPATVEDLEDDIPF